jgi:hypothetical protein
VSILVHPRAPAALGSTISSGGGVAAIGLQVKCASNVIDNTVTGYANGANIVLQGQGSNSADNVAVNV